MQLLASNSGKRRTEQVYVLWFLLTAPVQLLVTNHLSYTHYNDRILIPMAVVMGLGTLVLPVIFRAESDKGRPLQDLYAVRMGSFLVVWAMIGGFVGTDPWYEVLKGHFAFNTEFNPNGVPFFMLPMTVAVFAAYSVILGTLYRVVVQLAERAGGLIARDTWWRHGILILILAPLMPLVETSVYVSHNYCFDPGPGKWGLNLLIYGSWHLSALLFYPRFDRTEGERTPWIDVFVRAFATVGVIVFLMAMTKTAVAPHFTHVDHGAQFVNDWSANNCLGVKPK
jgi:hypothetical protein